MGGEARGQGDAAPGCTSLEHLDGHHLRYRSRSGHDLLPTTILHLPSEHGGLTRVTGKPRPASATVLRRPGNRLRCLPQRAESEQPSPEMWNTGLSERNHRPMNLREQGRERSRMSYRELVCNCCGPRPGISPYSRWAGLNMRWSGDSHCRVHLRTAQRDLRRRDGDGLLQKLWSAAVSSESRRAAPRA